MNKFNDPYYDRRNEFDRYDSYMEYKRYTEESKLIYLIRSKYLKLLGRFIETTFPGLKFDIIIRDRNHKERKVEWYGHTYMELVVFDVIGPVYDPRNFSATYRTPHYDGFLSLDYIYDEIDSFIPEINKHLLITFCAISTQNVHHIDDYQVQSLECWRRHYQQSYSRHPLNIF